MSKPYDAATKFLLERHPADWLAFAGLPTGQVEVVDADLASISASADKVFRVTGEQAWICHVELQSGYEGDMAERDALPDIIRRMDARISVEAAPREAEELWASTYLLMGLRYQPALSRKLLQGVRNMRESSTYQAILEEGRAEGEVRGEARGEAMGEIKEARSLIARLGRLRFGEPDPKTVAVLDAIVDIAVLEKLAERLLEVESWAELLAER